MITNNTIQNLSINESDLFDVELYPNAVIDKITIEVEGAKSWDIEILDNSMREMRIDVYSTFSKKEIKYFYFTRRYLPHNSHQRKSRNHKNNSKEITTIMAKGKSSSGGFFLILYPHGLI